MGIYVHKGRVGSENELFIPACNICYQYYDGFVLVVLAFT